MSAKELEELSKQLNELNPAGFIRPSKSPYASPVSIRQEEGWYHTYVRRLSCTESNDHQESISITSYR